MPLSNERGTPQWVATSREGVERYFRDLERVMAKHQVVDDVEKKEAAVLYMPIEVAKRWESLPAFDDSSKSFVAFRDEILSFYLGSDKDHKFTLREYDELVSSRLRTGLGSLAEYMSFYGEFYPIVRYLMSKSPPELTHRQVVDTLLRLLNDDRRPVVEARLSQKVPDKHREDSYTVDQVHEAISHVIDNRAAFPRVIYREPLRSVSPQPVEPPSHLRTTTSNESSDVTVKTEVLQQIIAAAIRTVRDDEASSNRVEPHPAVDEDRFPEGPPRYAPGHPRRVPGRPPCFYCGDSNCSIAICPVIEADVQEGLVVRDRPGGSVLLANGRKIPDRRVDGLTIRDAMRAFYNQNPDRRPTRRQDAYVYTL